MGSSPITRSTSEQATYRLLRLFLQKARARSFCCSSSSGKRHARLACSLASALATARCRYHLFPGGGPAVPLGQNESISRGPVCVSVGLRLIPWFQRMTAGFPPPLDLQTGCVKARSRAPRLPHSISLFDQLCAEQSHPNRSLWNIGQNCDSRHRSACAISLFQPVARGIISIRSKLRLPPPLVCAASLFQPVAHGTIAGWAKLRYPPPPLDLLYPLVTGSFVKAKPWLPAPLGAALSFRFRE